MVQLETEPMSIGRLCGSSGCCGLARWVVPWPGRGDGPRCDRHMHAAVKIADALGFDLRGITPLSVATINAPPDDPSAARFAAMELE